MTATEQRLLEELDQLEQSRSKEQEALNKSLLILGQNQAVLSDNMQTILDQQKEILELLKNPSSMGNSDISEIFLKDLERVLTSSNKELMSGIVQMLEERSK